jgi:hypothetical protein
MTRYFIIAQNDVDKTQKISIQVTWYDLLINTASFGTGKDNRTFIKENNLIG